MNRRGRVRGGNNQVPEMPAETTIRELMGAVGQVTNLLAQSIAINNQQQEQALHARNHLNDQSTPRTRSVLDDFRRENPLNFFGSTDIDVVEGWKESMIKKFNLLRCTEDEKLRFSIHKLEGDAERWWRTTEAILLREGPITWRRFQEAFDQKYYTDQMKDRKEAEFNKLIQGTMSVAEYESKFNSLSRFAEYMTSNDGRKARKFVKGLNTYIRKQMGLKRYEDYSKAVKHALNAEKNWADLPQESNQKFKRAPSIGGDTGNTDGGNPAEQKRQRQDSQGLTQEQYNNQNRRQAQDSNQGQGNLERQGTKQGNTPRPNQRLDCTKCGKRHFGACWTGKCFNCENVGHLSRDCPKPPRDRNVHNQGELQNEFSP